MPHKVRIIANNKCDDERDDKDDDGCDDGCVMCTCGFCRFSCSLISLYITICDYK